MFLPESIDLGQPEKYILSIRINPRGFMFSIYEPGLEKNYYLQETTFTKTDNILSNIQRIVFDLNFLTQEFKQTNVIIVSSRYELVPATYYQSEKKEALYNFTHTRKANHILSALIDKQDLISLYDIDKEIYDFLCRNLWNPRFFHHTFLLNSFLEGRVKSTAKGGKMYLNFHHDTLDIVCYSDNKLVSSLTYEDEPAMNQLYFVLKLWKESGFDQMKDYIYILGNADMKLVLQLQEYINNIERINAPSEVYLWNEDAQKAPLDLLSLAL